MTSYVEMARQVLAAMGTTADLRGDGPETAISPAELHQQSGSSERLARPSLKGQAVELWSDLAGGRLYIVADEEDAQEAIKRFGAGRGEVWTPGEIELVAHIQDQAVRQEVAAFKRSLDGCVRAPQVTESALKPKLIWQKDR